MTTIFSNKIFKSSVLILTLSAMTLLTGCATDAYTGESKVSNTAKGAGIGAGVAAVAAYVANRNVDPKVRNKRILQTAAAGGAIGGGVGLYMDKQESKLREQLASTGVSVVREGDNINLVMPGNITFTPNSSAVNPSFFAVLDSVAVVLNKFNQTIITVSGHTDSSGKAESNMVLSQQRASAVADYLGSKNIMPERFLVHGFGSRQPIADNATASGKEKNRRVEITLLPVTEESSK